MSSLPASLIDSNAAVLFRALEDSRRMHGRPHASLLALAEFLGMSADARNNHSNRHAAAASDLKLPRLAFNSGGSPSAAAASPLDSAAPFGNSPPPEQYRHLRVEVAPTPHGEQLHLLQSIHAKPRSLAPKKPSAAAAVPTLSPLIRSQTHSTRRTGRTLQGHRVAGAGGRGSGQKTSRSQHGERERERDRSGHNVN